MTTPHSGAIQHMTPIATDQDGVPLGKGTEIISNSKPIIASEKNADQ